MNVNRRFVLSWFYPDLQITILWKWVHQKQCAVPHEKASKWYYTVKLKTLKTQETKYSLCFDKSIVSAQWRTADSGARVYETLFAITCRSIRRGNLHGVRGNMGGVRPPVLAGAGERYSLLVARKLNELAKLFLSEHLQGDPEELDVLVGLHQTNLVHGVSL